TGAGRRPASQVLRARSGERGARDPSRGGRPRHARRTAFGHARRMISPAVVVPRAEGEAIRGKLKAGGWLRADLKVLRKGNDLAFPVRLPSEGRIPFATTEE